MTDIVPTSEIDAEIAKHWPDGEPARDHWSWTHYQRMKAARDRSALGDEIERFLLAGFVIITFLAICGVATLFYVALA